MADWPSTLAEGAPVPTDHYNSVVNALRNYPVGADPVNCNFVDFIQVGAFQAKSLVIDETIEFSSTSVTFDQVVATTFTGAFIGNVTGNVSGTAAGFTGSLVGDVTGGMGSTVVAKVGTKLASAVVTAVTAVEAATSANTASAIVRRDASGNFSAGMITGNLTGNVTGNCSGTAAGFTGSLVGDVTGGMGSTVVATVGGMTAANVAAGAGLANAATSAATNNAIARRSATGAVSFSQITTDGGTSGSGVGHLSIRAGTSVRFAVGLNVVESTGNAGSNFQIWRYSDAGAFLGTALTITRSTGAATFEGAVNATTFTGALTGNVTGNVTGNCSGSAASFTGSLVGDVTGGMGSTVVATVGGMTAANVAAGAGLANAATSAATNSAIVRRDSSGNFNAATVSLSGTLGFGSAIRQMLNLFGTAYAIGVQTNTMYFRSNQAFAWHKLGSHSDTQWDAGASGTNTMRLDTNGNLTVTGSVTAPGGFVGNASTATSATTAATASAAPWSGITGKPTLLEHNVIASGRFIASSNTVSTTHPSYIHAAIEIRETNLVTNTQTAAIYAPRISFHWGGDIATQLGMDSDGTIRTWDGTAGNYAPFSASLGTFQVSGLNTALVSYGRIAGFANSESSGLYLAYNTVTGGMYQGCNINGHLIYASPTHVEVARIYAEGIFEGFGYRAKQYGYHLANAAAPAVGNPGLTTAALAEGEIRIFARSGKIWFGCNIGGTIYYRSIQMNQTAAQGTVSDAQTIAPA